MLRRAQGRTDQGSKLEFLHRRSNCDCATSLCASGSQQITIVVFGQSVALRP